MRQVAGGQLVTRENGPVTHSFAAPDHLLNVKEAAALLNVPESWIYQHVRARAGDKLPHITLGKYIRFSAQGLMQWLETRQLGGITRTLVGCADVFRSATCSSAANESRFGLAATGNGFWTVVSPSKYNDAEFSGCVLR